MAKATGNLQDSVLNQLRKDNAEIEFFFLSGKSLKGTVRGFDNFTIVVRDAEGHHHLVYKHAIEHIASSKPFAIRQQSNGSHKRTENNTPSSPQPSADTTKDASAKKDKPAEPFNRIDVSQIKIEK